MLGSDEIRLVLGVWSKSPVSAFKEPGVGKRDFSAFHREALSFSALPAA